MTRLSTVPIHLAELPKPGWFLSWCLSSRFSWIRREAQAYRKEQEFCFRLKERHAIDEALDIERSVRKNLEFNASLTSIKNEIARLDKINTTLTEQIRTYPEVERILKATYADLLNRLKAIRIVTVRLPLQVTIYSQVFTKRSPRVEVSKVWDAVEVNYTPRLRR